MPKSERTVSQPFPLIPLILLLPHTAVFLPYLTLSPSKVIKSTLLNTISLIVIYAFDLFLVPLLGLSRSQLDMDEFSHPEHWLHRNVGFFYMIMFQLPVVMGALYLNVSRVSVYGDLWIE